VSSVGTYNVMEMYNPITDTWRSGVDLPVGVHAFHPVAHKGRALHLLYDKNPTKCRSSRLSPRALPPEVMIPVVGLGRSPSLTPNMRASSTHANILRGNTLQAGFCVRLEALVVIVTSPTCSRSTSRCSVRDKEAGGLGKRSA